MRNAVREKHPPGLAGVLRQWDRRLIPILSLAGMAVSGYLTYAHWAPWTPLCAGVAGCDVVNRSAYAEVWGLPVAALGFGTYAALFLLSLWPRSQGTIAPLAMLGLSLAGVVYSAYLTYIELFVLYAVCPWCVASALLITAIFLVAAKEVAFAH